MKDLSLIGLNYRSATLAVREQLSLPSALVPQLLQAFHREDVLDEVLVLDTCNRTEFYFVPRQAGDLLPYLLERVSQLKGVRIEVDESLLYRHEGLAAVRHLFRVAASLESQVVGEHQVLGQVKQAYRYAVEARTAKLLLNRLSHWAIRVGKRVRTETDLGRGNASIAQAAVSLARQIFSDMSQLTVLLVGAGQNAETAARALIQAGVPRLIVANRTPSRAQSLVEELLTAPKRTEKELPADDAVTCPAFLRHGGEQAAKETPAPQPRHDVAAQAIGLEGIAEVLGRADLVISSTGATDAVMTWEQAAEPLRRSGRSTLIVDIAVPRDVDSRLAELPNVFLYNIDDLNNIVVDDMRQREEEVPRAEAIVEEEVQDFSRWLSSLQVTPTIRRLQEHFAALQEQQMARYAANVERMDREQLEQFTEALCRRILHQPVEFLKEVCENGSTSDALAAIDLVQRMFGLSPEEKQENR